MDQKINPETSPVKQKSTEKASTEWWRVSPTNSAKEQTFLEYINQKLHQWPFWSKIVVEQPENPYTEKNSLELQLKRRGYQIEQVTSVPSQSYVSRGGGTVRYNYFHHEPQNTTYFFPYYCTYREERHPKGQRVYQLPAQLTTEQSYADSSFKTVSMMHMEQAKKEIRSSKYYK